MCELHMPRAGRAQVHSVQMIHKFPDIHLEFTLWKKKWTFYPYEAIEYKLNSMA